MKHFYLFTALIIILLFAISYGEANANQLKKDVETISLFNVDHYEKDEVILEILVFRNHPEYAKQLKMAEDFANKATAAGWKIMEWAEKSDYNVIFGTNNWFNNTNWSHGSKISVFDIEGETYYPFEEVIQREYGYTHILKVIENGL